MKQINIKGSIIPKQNKWIYDWFEYPYTVTDDVIQALQEARGDDVEVYINSPGGSVYDAYEIYTALKDYKGNVLIKIVGLAASAASFIATARNCVMSPLAEIMIHNASTGAQGPHQVMDATSQMLQVTDRTIAQAYVIKTGKSEEEIRALMEKETWFTAQEAKELGLIDSIMFENEGKVNNLAPILYNSLPMPNNKAFEELLKVGSMEELQKRISLNKEEFTKNVLMSQPAVINTAVDNKVKEVKSMTRDELKNQFPETFNAIYNEGVTGERARIKDIEDLAIPGNEDLVNKAKFETGITAEKLAVEIVKAEKSKGNAFLERRQADATASNVNAVTAAADPNKINAAEDEEETAKSIANAANSRRRG